MKRLIFLPFFLFAQPAFALSCIFGDVSEAFEEAQEHPGTAYPAVGNLTFLNTDLELYLGGFQMEFEGQDFAEPAYFKGHILTPNTAPKVFEGKITVHAACLNGDCGYAKEHVELITFLNDSNGQWIMHAYPCQSYPTSATPESIKELQHCLDRGQCKMPHQ